MSTTMTALHPSNPYYHIRSQQLDQESNTILQPYNPPKPKQQSPSDAPTPPSQLQRCQSEAPGAPSQQPQQRRKSSNVVTYRTRSIGGPFSAGVVFERDIDLSHQQTMRLSLQRCASRTRFDAHRLKVARTYHQGAQIFLSVHPAYMLTILADLKNVVSYAECRPASPALQTQIATLPSNYLEETTSATSRETVKATMLGRNPRGNGQRRIWSGSLGSIRICR